METFTYKINKTETTNWQEAIDLFEDVKVWTAFCPVIVTNSSGVIVMYLNDFEDIQGWSERLMNTRLNEEGEFDEYGNYGENNGALSEFKPKNRVEARIYKELQEQEADGMGIVESVYDKIDLPLTGDLSDTTTELDFHGNFSGMTAEVKDSIINPKHYKLFSPDDYADYPKGIEYMDLCDKALAHLSGVESHLVGQILKYALRVGKKDAMEQDATKIEWYATRLVNTVKGK